MKIIINKSQYRVLIEQKLIGYTPEKIDVFIKEGMGYIEKYMVIYQKYYHDLFLVKVGDMFNNLDKYKGIINEMEKNIDFLDKLSSKYFNIIEMYEVGEYPENLMKLDDIYQDIENLKDEIDDIKDIYESLYNEIEHFIKYRSKTEKWLTGVNTINI